MKGVTIASLAEMRVFAESILKNLKPGRKTATVFGLRGDLGAGKTAFVKAVADVLGVKEHITSPTFVIMKKYALSASDFASLVHVDAYRLQSGDELKKIGWEEIVAEPGNIVFIEWPENVSDALPEGIQHIEFDHVDEKTRNVNVL